MLKGIKKKRGRPLKEGSKEYRCTMRLTKEQYDMLNDLHNLTGETKTDLIVQGLNMVNNLKKIQFDD